MMRLGLTRFLVQQTSFFPLLNFLELRGWSSDDLLILLNFRR